MKKTKEDEIIALRKQGKTYKQIEDALGVSAVTICKYLTKNRLLKSDIYSDDVMKKVKEMAVNGVGVRKISEELNIPYNPLRHYMSKRRIRVSRCKGNIARVLAMPDYMTPKVVAERLDLDVHYVRVVRYRNGIERVTKAQRIEYVGKLVGEGRTIKEAAELMGIKESTAERYLYEANR